MSGSNPVVTRVNPAAGGTDPITMSVNGSIIVQFYVRDVNDNSMPANTDVALSASGAGLQVGQPSSFKVPCSFSNGPSSSTLYSFSLTAGGTPGSGIATLSVKTAGVQAAGVGSLETIFQIPVTVQ
ncbi:MAG TPA: hypothetical protein P5528_05900 [Steroidobacteraceae bacterium]|nr:hypothetical protein [Steroidobacteraceae bacterium]